MKNRSLLILILIAVCSITSQLMADEPVNAKEKASGVTIATLKSTYAGGEPVLYKISNNSNAPIYVDNSALVMDILQKKDDKWIEAEAVDRKSYRLISENPTSLTSIEAGKTLAFAWPGRLFDPVTGHVHYGKGIFKLKRSYFSKPLGENKNTSSEGLDSPIVIESNEFEIT